MFYVKNYGVIVERKLNLLITERDRFVKKMHENAEESAVLFEAMASMGLRYVEANELSRWSRKDKGIYLMKSGKGSDPRAFYENEIPEQYRMMIDTGIKTASMYSYSTNIETFDKYFLYSNCKIGKKKVKTHIFRYIKIWEMINAGKRIDYVKGYIGHVEESTTKKYIDAKITLQDGQDELREDVIDGITSALNRTTRKIKEEINRIIKKT